MMTHFPGVLHHSFVERRGGAARVADLLAQAMAAAGMPTARSFEAVQTQAGQDWLDARQGDWFRAIEAALAAGWAVHLHSSGNILGLLERLAPLVHSATPSPLLLTYHDMRLATGGCVFPTDCPKFAEGCPDPCPRGLQDTAARRRRAAELLLALRPLGICPSQWGCQLLRGAIPGLKVHLVPNGIPWPAHFPGPQDKRAAKAAVGVAGSARLVVFVAHGGEGAGVKAGEVWLPLWERIKRAVPQAVGYFIGGKTHCREGDLVRWPYLEPERLAGMFTAADCLAYPSWADNHPLTLLEAMAHGCPVAAWGAGGIDEIVTPGTGGHPEDHTGGCTGGHADGRTGCHADGRTGCHADGRTGLLRATGDLAGLGEDVITLLTQPNQGRVMAAAAYRAGAARFAQSLMARRVLRLITESRAA
ncbi:glycosyltransferase [Megalodesulfovibrio paquesii]